MPMSHLPAKADMDTRWHTCDIPRDAHTYTEARRLPQLASRGSRSIPAKGHPLSFPALWLQGSTHKWLPKAQLCIQTWNLH